MNINHGGRTVKKKTQMSKRGMSDSGRTREMVVIPRQSVLEMEEKFKTLSESKLTPLQSVVFHLWVRASSPYCSHLALDSDSGLSFGVKEILWMFLSSAVHAADLYF